MRAGIEGTVFASAVVDENRSIKELAIIRGIGAGCDESVLRALASAKFVLAVAREKDKGAEKIPIIVDFVLPRK
ncbi:MAG: energy transducer TonB [Ignavibacteriales bacterium]|nr:energy transducer TonB [Ignavibacteriales bacterium]